MKKILKNKKGSSIISVMAAFVILLVGIAGFYTAVQTTNDMVTKAANLNYATGEVLQKFYKAYQKQPSFSGQDDAYKGYVVNITEKNAAGTAPAFFLRGSMHDMGLKATITTNHTDSEGNTQPESEVLDYKMYYFK